MTTLNKVSSSDASSHGVIGVHVTSSASNRDDPLTGNDCTTAANTAGIEDFCRLSFCL